MPSLPTQEQIEAINAKYGSQYALATEVNHLLTDVAANQTAAINTLHKHQKMKITPLSLLYDIITHGGTSTQTELSDYFPYTKQAMTLALNYLEEQELVVRQPDPADRRIKNISITTNGLEVAEASMEIRHAFYEKFSHVLSKEEAETLCNLLGKVNVFYQQFI